MTKPKPEPRPISGWHIQATCPLCGHILAHQAEGRRGGVVARALARCTGCDALWKVEITLEAAHTDGRRLRAQRGAA